MSNISTVTYVTERLRELVEHEYACMEDAHLFGAPSECYSLIYKQHTSRALWIIEEFYCPAHDYLDELKSRTSEKWAYFRSGIGALATRAELLREEYDKWGQA